MKKIFYSIILIVFIIILSFLSLKERKNISLGNFYKLPDVISNNSGCIYFNSKEDMENNKKYLGADDFASTFFLMINGKIVRFLSNNLKEKNAIYISDFNKYLLEITVINTISKNTENVNDKFYEYFEIYGNIKVTDIKNKNSTTKDFVGYCS